jgi:hypothetical protein
MNNGDNEDVPTGARVLSREPKGIACERASTESEASAAAVLLREQTSEPWFSAKPSFVTFVEHFHFLL